MTGKRLRNESGGVVTKAKQGELYKKWQKTNKRRVGGPEEAAPVTGGGDEGSGAGGDSGAGGMDWRKGKKHGVSSFGNVPVQKRSKPTGGEDRGARDEVRSKQEVVKSRKDKQKEADRRGRKGSKPSGASSGGKSFGGSKPGGSKSFGGKPGGGKSFGGGKGKGKPGNSRR